MTSPITSEGQEAQANPAAHRLADDWMVRLDEVEVEYRSPRERIRTLKEYAIRLLQGRVKYDRFRALDGVSFDVRHGEVFGVIGRNGAGKSTLLKVVSRVIKPTGGRVRVRGRVAPLLELGAGFHPELSGRENIYLNGTLLGYKKAELDELFDGIVEFAELWDFIDAPLRTYSTGMAVRLGFAVATATQPDLLLVDEVLSVGDERFREKCAERMRLYRENGATILLVTHDIGLITRMCDRAVCLNHGRIAALGAIDEVIEAYRSLNQFDPRLRRAATAPESPAPNAQRDERAELVADALQRSWRYPYDLPGGAALPSTLSPELVQLQKTRRRMVQAAVETALPGPPSGASCLEIGCGQGYFALQLAQAGFEKVVGIDGSEAEIQDARLLRRLYEAANLEFHQADFARLEADSFGQFDLVLLAGVLEQSENPIRTLRAAKAFARRAVIVETAVMPDGGGQDAFTLVDRVGDDSPLRLRGAPPLSLIPSLRTLQAVMARIGFARIERISAPAEPADARAEYDARRRVMLVGFSH